MNKARVGEPVRGTIKLNKVVDPRPCVGEGIGLNTFKLRLLGPEDFGVWDN